MRICSLLFIVFSLGYSYSQKTLLKGAKIHVGNGNVIEEGYLGIENDKIILVKNMLVSSIIANEWDSIIDVSGNQIYPGFVASNTTLGLT